MKHSLLPTLCASALIICGCSGSGSNDDATEGIQGNSPAVTIATTADDWSEPTDMSLLWGDEFNGASIDTEAWGYDTVATGWSKSWNNELQDYVDAGAGGENASIGLDGEASCLVIKATSPTPDSYASVRMTTKGKHSWQHGITVASRMKLPYGQGIWPAFWMLPETGTWPDSGEIDLMEMIGGGAGRDNKTYGTLHGPGYSGGSGIQGSVVLGSGNFSDSYHVFEIRWTEGQIAWYIDGRLYHTVKATTVPGAWPFDDKDFFILFNLAVGGGWPGNPDAATAFPQSMYIDWVRVYR